MVVPVAVWGLGRGSGRKTAGIVSFPAFFRWASRILTDTGAVGTWQNDRDGIKAASGLACRFDVGGAPWSKPKRKVK
jgi:hypothetical protein